MKSMTYVFLSMLTLASTNLYASTLTLQTRSIDNTNIFNNKNIDYQKSWNKQKSAISTQSLSAFDDLKVASTGSKKDVFLYFIANFSIGEDAATNDWGFRAGLDAGHGGALYLDGNLLDVKSDDLWWKHNWNNSSEILSATGLNLSVGNHVLEMFWAESCCHGSADAQFSLNGNWDILSTNNLNTVSLSAVTTVPVPMAVWLFASGIIAIFGVQRKSQQADTIEQNSNILSA
jgi:hypothetical protein